MTDGKKLLKQSSQYLLGQILVMAAGFISFPVLTRVLSVENYGILGIATTTIMLSTAIAKVGSTNSTVRFFPEYKKDGNLNKYYSTMIFGYAGIAFAVSLFLLIISSIFDIYGKSNFLLILSVVSVAFLMSMYNVIQGVLRADQKVRNYILINLVLRYGTIVFGILALYLFMKEVEVYLIAQALVLLCILFLVIFLIGKNNIIRISFFSKKLFQKSVKYGFFLSVSEIFHLILAYGDRYFIRYFLGASALGIYTAGYNLSTYIVEVFMYPVNNAIDPIYLNIHANKGVIETSKFLSKAFKFYFIFMLFAVLLFLSVSRELVVMLASNKYESAFKIMPYIVIANAIYSFQIIINAGLIINNKTQILAMIKFGSCIINIILNIILIPLYGIIGAAQATLISYFIYLLAVKHYSFKELYFIINGIWLIKYLLLSFLIYSAVHLLPCNGFYISVALKIAIVFLCYLSFVWLTEDEVKETILKACKTRFRKE